MVLGSEQKNNSKRVPRSFNYYLKSQLSNWWFGIRNPDEFIKWYVVAAEHPVTFDTLTGVAKSRAQGRQIVDCKQN
jgi:hypothetical protein